MKRFSTKVLILATLFFNILCVPANAEQTSNHKTLYDISAFKDIDAIIVVEENPVKNPYGWNSDIMFDDFTQPKLAELKLQFRDSVKDLFKSDPSIQVYGPEQTEEYKNKKKIYLYFTTVIRPKAKNADGSVPAGISLQLRANDNRSIIIPAYNLSYPFIITRDLKRYNGDIRLAVSALAGILPNYLACVNKELGSYFCDRMYVMQNSRDPEPPYVLKEIEDRGLMNKQGTPLVPLKE